MTSDALAALGLVLPGPMPGLLPGLLLGLLLGVLLGLAYFGGLWAQARALSGWRRPRLAWWSWRLARLALALAGFRLALALGPGALALALAGFLAARTWLVQRLGRAGPGPGPRAREA